MFKKLKALFIAEDQGDLEEALKKAKKEEPLAPSPERAPTAPTSSPQVTTAHTNPQGQVNDKFINILFGAMENANLPSFDYIEYKQALRNLAKMPMDEATRFKSAFATAKTMGATPQKLINAASHYLQILQQEEHKFQQALAHQRNKQIGDKEKSIQNLHQQIQHKEQQIEQLRKEILNDKNTMEAMKKEISSASLKVEKTKNDFMASYHALVGQIQADIEKMKKYLT